ncbi:type II CRISPR RNA-guided endonuclease Cas9 [Pedobacter endophyticus]|uniref:CRISPR-associated endonuclease Cas9 n=1 Tax=Pedobacter endophyticus TaxID=2789740 RepID=A0A7S9L1A6_9SPHI|nr:type II CRISPR RNA-guided endonuclease Cas9 [Pedobacter endophyticus]QPH40649.1 type II CRISPR RNA-guided endonuclease Cas9 [Pedobacter endophyticus]
MKNILGLDLGTNSIGWALIQQDFEKKQGTILGMGSRIIPMSQDILGDFGKGNSVSQTAERTSYRGVRRLRERFLLRRERLHRVLNILSFLPQHYAAQIDFEKRLGKFIDEKEPKLAYRTEWNEAKEKAEHHFIFKNAFEEMLADFQQHQPHVLINKDGDAALVPYDWTIYYLRKKALTKKINKEELAWILLNFNQKRGYYQLRGEEEEENPNKLIEFHSLNVVDVIADEPQRGKADIWYSLVLENGWVYRRSSKTPLFDWKDKIHDFIVTTDLNDDGSVKTDKEGNEKRSFRAPGESDWTLLKKKTEREIEKSEKTVGTFIYDTLLQDHKQKIKGKLVRTIERKFYKDELGQIIQKQKEFHTELENDDLYNDCVRELYRNNEAHLLQLSQKNFTHLFINDIIFYQRPLRSQKSSIGNCGLEYRTYRDNEGVEHRQYLKTIPKSNPYYQEFRVWQWLYNLKIYRKDDDTDVTDKLIGTTKDLEQLFDFLMDRREIDQKILMKYLFSSSDLKGKALTTEINQYRWNYVYDAEKDVSKSYPCNETRGLISSRFEKVDGASDSFLTKEIEQQLWHLIYSVTDKTEYEKALRSFASKHALDKDSFVEAFKKFPPFKSEYGSFSEKALKKLLPLMRLGKHWDEKLIIANSTAYWNNISKILERLDKKSKSITEKDKEDWNKTINTNLEAELSAFLDGEVQAFQGLRLHIAQYLVYGRHAEAADTKRWNTVNDLEKFLEEFKQHSLRNPIVEQVVTETLRVVKDIWKKYGNGIRNFFTEIHVELGREMKNTADKRKQLTNRISENENTNLRIKAMLIEMTNDDSVFNVRPYSPMQQDILKVYEEGVLNSAIEIDDEILKISKMAQPSSSDLKRYKLWLEQKYRSPYTGEIIPLNKLFTPEYEIEHIIPQSRYFDDSLSNKVICEAAVNKLKDNQMGLAFIKKFPGEIVPLGMGKSVKIFNENAYVDFVKHHYAKNRGKRNKLLLEEIPEAMIERQLNDTRYISKYISGLLSSLVRAEENDEGPNSKYVIPGNGKITGELKQDWGLNDIWNDLILPRFERFNQLTGETHFTAWNENHHKYLPTVPLALYKGFSKKRIDHRHHALDALVIACATREHVNLLNNKHAKSKNERHDLKRNLMQFERTVYKHPQTGERIERDVAKAFEVPWNSFKEDARNALKKIVISFKQNLRVINKATNYYESFKDEAGNLRVDKDGKAQKSFIEQQSTNWAIRKAMHKETVYGKVDLPRIKVPKGKILTATRKSLDSSFNLKSIENITDTGIQKILRNYLVSKDGDSELAFSPEGVEDLNKNIQQYNDGKAHQPIYKVRVFEVGSKFPLGEKGNKRAKYVEAAKGTNLFFAVYWDEDKQKRNYDTIPLNEVIEHQKWRATLSNEERKDTPMIPIDTENGKFLFSLSPNDLVYVPTEEEKDSIEQLDFSSLNTEQITRIYKMVSSTGSECHFIQSTIASLIKSYDAKSKVGEMGSLNKLEITIDTNPIRIKETCIKLKVDRLGNISKA